MPKNNGKKKLSIENIPLETRKKLLWIIVAIITLIIIIVWFSNFNFIFSKIESVVEEDSKLKETTQELGDLFFEAKEQFSNFKNELIPLISQIPTTTPTTTSTTTNQLTQEQIELIKKEIEKISTTTSTTTKNNDE